MHPTRMRIASSCCALRVRGARDEVRLVRHEMVRVSVGGSFAARWARMVLKRCSSERGEREKRFYGDGKGERRRTAYKRAAQNSLNASGAKLTRACVPRTVNGTGHKLRWNYARALYEDPGATLDDLREAVATLEDTARTAQRVFGGTHPMVVDLERSLRESRAALSTRGGNG